MPSLSAYKRRLNGGSTVGEIAKTQADLVMEVTWDNDIATRDCYLYDFYHDDSLAVCEGMTYENTVKTKVRAKFLVTAYQTLSKDLVEYDLMLKPTFPRTFKEGDELYYYQRDFADKYGAKFPVGLYVDIPDDRGVYQKWLICGIDLMPQFIKCEIIPITYKLQWIEERDGHRYKRAMWCALRSQSSYNSGLWTDEVFTSQENQEKAWLPLNDVTKSLYYTHINGSGRNQRVLVGAFTETPNAWQISKVENTSPFGMQKITLYQTLFDQHCDYVNLDSCEMYADYYTPESQEEPEDGTSNGLIPAVETAFIAPPIKEAALLLSAASNTIKVGGSYKTISIAVMYGDIDVTEDYTDIISDGTWSVTIDDEETDLYTIVETSDATVVRVKYTGDSSNTDKIMAIMFTTSDGALSGTLNLTITSA